MNIYHFTANRYLQRIQKEGITRGVFPLQINGDLKFMTNCQWLTSNSSFDQPWHDPELTRLKYDRRENRLTIKIPKHHYKNLRAWVEIKGTYGEHFFSDFDSHEDCKNWMIYIGRIKPKWIIKVENKVDNNL